MRIFRLLLVPMIATALAVALLSGVRSGAQTPAAAAVQSIAPSPAAKIVAPAARVQQPDQPAVPAAATAAPRAATAAVTAEPLSATTESDLSIARVNGEPILPEEFAAAAAIDGAMSALLGMTPTTSAHLTEQLVNHRLVLRAAAAAGVAPSNAGQRLIDLLAAHGKTPADLDALLAAQGVTPAAFQIYLGQLVLVDEFARGEATRQGVTVEAYVAALQAAADIRYGSAVATELARAVVAPVQTTPTKTAPIETAPTQTAPIETAPIENPVSRQAPVSELSTAPQQTPAGAAEEARGVLLGQLAPQFSLAKLGTEDTVASDDLLGTPTVLSFWTTWCPYCLRQTPIMVAAAARYAAADVQFVGIDVGEKPDVVVPYVAEHAISYPILLDAASDAAATFGISGYPTTYFLDADGRIVAHHIGAMTEQQLTEYIEELLATG